jgi:hypothetical protein
MRPYFFFTTLIACLLGVSPSTAQNHSAGSLSLDYIKAVVDSLSIVLQRCYVFPDKAELMKAEIQSQLKNGLYKKLNDPLQLTQHLNMDLQKVNRDIHLTVFYDPMFEQMESERNTQREAFASLELAQLKENNFLFKRVEILPGNIGYFNLTGFNNRTEESKSKLNAIFTFLQDAKAVIIDLRENNGGNPETVRQLESYFFSKRTHIMDIVDRVDDKTYAMWADPAYTDSIYLSVPLYILTSRMTASAAEDFCYGMQSAKRAIVVGETTAGGAHLTKPFSVGNGFVVAIPFARSVNPYTNTNWEGVGVLPDVKVRASNALLRAQEIFFSQQLSVAKDVQQKRKIQWMLHKLKADNNREEVKPATLLQYIGTYEGGLDFHVDGERLLCKNAERGNAIFPMQKVSDGLFFLDENVIVEFVKDSTNVYSSINMLWKDGWVTTKKRMP